MNQKEIFFGMKQINRAITAVFCAMAACVLLLILFAFETTAFSGKVNFVLPQWSMMIIGLAVLFAAYAVSEGFGRGHTRRTGAEDRACFLAAGLCHAGERELFYILYAAVGCGQGD